MCRYVHNTYLISQAAFISLIFIIHILITRMELSDLKVYKDPRRVISC